MECLNNCDEAVERLLPCSCPVLPCFYLRRRGAFVEVLISKLNIILKFNTVSGNVARGSRDKGAARPQLMDK